MFVKGQGSGGKAWLLLADHKHSHLRLSLPQALSSTSPSTSLLMMLHTLYPVAGTCPATLCPLCVASRHRQHGQHHPLPLYLTHQHRH
ncbi:hypothetical protein ACLKA6_015062 [Drosophila palustris]